MGIKYVTNILNGLITVSDQEAPILYSSEQELADFVAILIEKEYAFTDAPAGWPPAAVVQSLKDKGLMNRSFIAITWSGSGEYRTYEIL